MFTDSVRQSLPRNFDSGIVSKHKIGTLVEFRSFFFIVTFILFLGTVQPTEPVRKGHMDPLYSFLRLFFRVVVSRQLISPSLLQFLCFICLCWLFLSGSVALHRPSSPTATHRLTIDLDVLIGAFVLVCFQAIFCMQQTDDRCGNELFLRLLAFCFSRASRLVFFSLTFCLFLERCQRAEFCGGFLD